jgi:hypothetical protein
VRHHLIVAKERVFDVADLYERSDGLVLLLRTTSLEAIAELRDLFTRLAETPGLQVDLASEIGTKIGGTSSAVMECAEGIGFGAKGIHVKRERGADLPKFLWRLSPDGWQRCAEMMEPLLEPGSGHQYLGQGSADDADVEVDFIAQ